MKHDTPSDYRERLLRVLLHIQEHLDDALPLDELAGVAFFSPYHFHRVFRGMTGESAPMTKWDPFGIACSPGPDRVG